MRKHDSIIVNEALNLAKNSNMRSKHGSIIIDKKGNVISSAWNTATVGNSNVDERYKNGEKISRHAEENVLRFADHRKLQGARLYVVRCGQDNKPLNSKPCDRCMAIINSCMKKYGLKVVYYTS
jgi:tRNA(Arg) A34 adenosine deaminase TadA